MAMKTQRSQKQFLKKFFHFKENKHENLVLTCVEGDTEFPISVHKLQEQALSLHQIGK